MPSAVVDHEPETNNEQRNSTSNQPEQATIRQLTFSDKTSNESEQSTAPLMDDSLKTRIEAHINTVFTNKIQEQVESFFNEWKSERQSETQSQNVSAISRLQPVTTDELDAKLEPLKESVNNTIVRTSQLESKSESITPEIEEFINHQIETAYGNAWDNGTLSKICREALDEALRDEEFVTKLGTAFLQTTSLHGALSELTKRLAHLEVKRELKTQMKPQETNRQQPQQDLRVGRATVFAQPTPDVPVQAQNVASADYTEVTSAPMPGDDGDPSDDDGRSERSRSNKSRKNKKKKEKQETTKSNFTRTVRSIIPNRRH